MFNVIGKRFWYFLISGILIMAAIVALGVFGLQPGVDFKGGAELKITFRQPVNAQQVTQALAEMGYSGSNALVIPSGNDYTIDLPDLSVEAKQAVLAGLDSKVGAFDSQGFKSVAPKAAEDTTRNAAIAVILSSIGMLLYVSWAFHRMPNPFRWGVCAIAALVIDVVIVIGLFALMGGLLGWQIDLLFIAAVLTVIGYAINDTIVIFDRIRENVKNYGEADFEGVVNYSLVETMSRTLITGIGTIFTLVALLIIVGQPLQNLVAVLLVGILVGTYGSIGTAASLLVVWKKNEWGRFIGRKPATR